MTPAPPPYRATLASPQLHTDHPVWVYPDAYASDNNRRENIAGTGGITFQDHTEKYVIVWALNSAYVKYRVYGSISPARQTNLLQDDLTTNQYEFFPPVFSEVLRYYFWVAGVDVNGVETYLSQTPASLETTAVDTAIWPNPISANCVVPDADGINCETAKAYEYIQNMNRLELQMNGELAYLHIRRHGSQKPWGVPCSCNDSMNADSDPDYQGRGRCSLCFGTGVFAGYYPAIPVMIRYSSQPEQIYKYTKRGMETSHAFNTYMLWEPIVNVDDLIIRASDGSRYMVSKRKETSARAIRLHQEFDLTAIEKTDIKYEVSDKTIADALSTAQVPGWLRDRFRIFG
jgi:predicted GNAT family acetyltransferase